MKRSRPIILAHGGAGARAMAPAQATCLAEALVAGYEMLQRGAASIQAVEETICVLEASGLFNAGIGSRRQMDGVMRMDASIMEGRSLKAGAVASIEQIAHPITAARLVLQETTHVLLAGRPATNFAKHFKLDRQPTVVPRQHFRKRVLSPALSQKTLHLYRAMAAMNLKGDRRGRETVGAVALDKQGTVASGASTGGIDLMLPGRVGDTPLIGCGVYADNKSGAVSMTGLGESIIRLAVAKEIADRLENGQRPSVAGQAVLRKLVARIHGSGGALILSPAGRFAISHTTPYMSAGHWDGKGKPVVTDLFK